MQLTATLVADGSSDSLLKPILEWLLSQHFPTGTTLDIRAPEWGSLPAAIPRRTLPEKLAAAHAFFAAPLYFLHRDAERDGTWEERRQEITHAVQQVFKEHAPPYICVIPVQMTETWLWHNEAAIRTAAENPRGREPVLLPHPARLETEKDAKMQLLAILRAASGLTGRHLRRFEAYERRRLHRLVALQQTQGFDVLRVLPAFQQLEDEIAALAAAIR